MWQQSVTFFKNKTILKLFCLYARIVDLFVGIYIIIVFDMISSHHLDLALASSFTADLNFAGKQIFSIVCFL